MLKHLLIFFHVFGLCHLNSYSQKRCATDILHELRMTSDGEYRRFRLQSEKQLNSAQTTFKSAALIKIPIVVHVVYFEDSLSQNVSDEQIHSQIEVLNKDFNKLNWDTLKAPAVWKNLIADCGIEFVLANRDPNGNLTKGITRKSTDISEIGNINGDLIYFSSKGGQDIWDRDSYLNIWVCDIAGGIYGFSGYPGSPSESDGIVIDYKSFGSLGTATAPTERGRTLTHELGHWFNLFHLWGTSQCGDDLVNDTPTQEKPNYDCPFFPTLSSACPNGPNGDMFNNYMDYADDNCMNMFTIGQKDRMINALNTFRASLFNSTGYNSVLEPKYSFSRIYPLPCQDYLTIELSDAVFVKNVQIIDLNGSVVKHITINQVQDNYVLDVVELKNALYVVKIQTNDDVLLSKMSVWR